MSRDKQPITMQNELYLALLEAKKDNTQKLSFYIDSVGVTKLIADLENLLLLQREKCAERVMVIYEGQGACRECGYTTIDYSSITNANILNQ